jgi:PadR family transcriptional regulator AphA
MARKPTTSSYAVLALLDLRPWTGYELTVQARRSLTYAWPKSVRLLYSEPKKLVGLGYATTHKETVGNRSRNVYEITDEGRAALKGWMAMRSQPPRIEVEALLRVLFADLGSVEDLRVVLGELEDDIGERHQAVVSLMASYLEGSHPFPDRTHLSVLFATFQVEIFKSIERWVEFAQSEIDDWPTTANLGMNPRTKELTRLLAADESPVAE